MHIVAFFFYIWLEIIMLNIFIPHNIIKRNIHQAKINDGEFSQEN